MKEENDEKQNSHKNEVENESKKFVPLYLAPYIQFHDQEFWVSLSFEPILIAHLMSEGFLPIAAKQGGRYFLLPKLHLNRCIVDLRHLHCKKSTRKASNRWNITINKALDDVIQGCQEQHSDSWLYPPLVSAYKFMAQNSKGMNTINGSIVRFYSTELWNRTTGKLEAGELGYTVGEIYTSLTGFHNAKSAGSVQLAALGGLLTENNFKMWDLGMDMPYKLDLGAQLLPREQFINEVYKLRQNTDNWIQCQDMRNARTAVDSIKT